MKKLILLLVVLGTSVASVPENQLTKKERKFAINSLETAMKDIFKTVEHLSEEQWTYKPSPDSWSVAEACEHLLIVENNLYQLVSEKIIKDQANRNNIKKEEKITNEQLLSGITNRGPGNKLNAPEAVLPQGSLKTAKEFIRQYAQARDKTISFTKTTDSDLNSYYYQSPAGKLSAYQWILLMAGHSMRHHEQIKEVMANDSFPADQ